MYYYMNELYPDNEKELLNKINNLMNEWEAEFDVPICRDGFYPNYTNQKIKILFIGRESIGPGGDNYIKVLHECYTKTFKIGRRSLARYSFHKRMLRIAYGIIHNLMSWEDIPYVNEIGKKFGLSDGISFAFMNLSKIANSSDKWQTCHKRITHSIEMSCKNNRNLIKEEIELLSPDIIISANIGNYLEKILDTGGGDFWEDSKVNKHTFKIGSKDVLWMDTYHFSAFKKKDYEDFYKPICNVINAHKML